MTAIVGLVQDSTVYMGADSIGFNVDTYGAKIRKDRKVFKVKDFVIGYTSSFRMGQLLRFSFVPPVHDNGVDIYEYMCTSFVDALRTCFKDGGYSRIENNVEEGGEFLVGYKGRLFRIEDSFQVEEVLHNYNVCGCGIDLMLGSLYTSEKLGISDPVLRIKMALSSAEEFSAGVRSPFNFEILKYKEVRNDTNEI